MTISGILCLEIYGSSAWVIRKCYNVGEVIRRRPEVNVLSIFLFFSAGHSWIEVFPAQRILVENFLCKEDYDRVSTHFFSKVSDFPWLFWTQVPSLSLISARNEWQGSHIFSKSNSMSFKEIHGENLHNFTEILFMIYVYHCAAFTFEVSFSTPNMMPDECASTWWTKLEALIYMTVCRHFQ